MTSSTKREVLHDPREIERRKWSSRFKDGIHSWSQVVQKYETDDNRNVRIKRLESVINTVFNSNYRGGLVKWIQDYEDAFTELALPGEKTWNDDEIKKRCFLQNAQNTGLLDTVFE
jgi:hypothetical protein